MGHLINAKSTRIGWIYNWCDVWFVDSLYYPEFLHALIKMRYYLVYFFFFNKILDKLGFFFSCFDLSKFTFVIHTRLFLYDGPFEGFLEKFFFKFKMAIKDLNSQDPNKYKPVKSFEHFRWFLFFTILVDIEFETEKAKEKRESAENIKDRRLFLTLKKWNTYFKTFKNVKPKNLIKFFQTKKYYKGYFRRNVLSEGFLYYTLVYLTKKNMTSYLLVDYYNVDLILRRWLHCIYSMFITSPFYKVYSRFVSYVFFCLTNKFRSQIHFILIANQQITAKFLARFICKKLSQNYPLRFLLNPIIKELKLVWKERKINYKLTQKGKVGKFLNLTSYKYNKKTIFVKLLIILFTTYFKRYSIFFFNYKTWFSLDMLYLYIWSYSLNNRLFNIGSSINYFIKKPAFICFFNKAYRVLKTEKVLHTFFIKTSSGNLIFNNRSNYIKYFSLFFEELNSSSNSIFYFDEKKYTIELNSIRIAGAHLNEFINYYFWAYNYTNLPSRLVGNNLRDRFKTKVKRSAILKGFKFHLKGRFSRRQRSKSAWYIYGRVPLNSLSENIDYDFHTVPLRNSVIIIKVWLNRGERYERYELDNYYL